MKFHYIIYLLYYICLISCSDDSKTTTKDQYVDKIKKNVVIKDIVDISTDSILAIKDMGIMFSKDAGKTWIDLNAEYSFDEITITSNNILVGINSWEGIHEKGFSRLIISYDFGVNWKIIEFETNNFFPIKIISKPKQKLAVLTEDNKIFEFNGTNFLKHWIYLGQGDNADMNNQLRDSYYGIDNSNTRNIKLYRKKVGIVDTIFTLDSSQEVLTMIRSENKLHMSGAGINKDGKSNGYYAQLINDKILREYLLPGKHYYLKETQLKRIYLIGNGRCFLIVNDSLISMNNKEIYLVL